jgi:hypothetical protein
VAVFAEQALLGPRFEFFLGHFPEPSEAEKGREVWEKIKTAELWNRGAALLDYELHQRCFLVAYEYGVEGHQYARVIPVVCPYDRIYTQATEGLLVTLTANEDLVASLERIETDFRRVFKSWGAIQFKALLEIAYTDHLRRNEIATYDLTPFDGWLRPNVPVRLPFTLADQRFRDLQQPVFLVNVTGKTLKAAWNTYRTPYDIKFFRAATDA